MGIKIFLLKLVIPMIIGIVCSYYLIYKVDNKFKFTEKVRRFFKLTLSLEVFAYLSICLVVIFTLMFLSINLIEINDIIYQFLLGTPMGMFFYIGGKNYVKIKNESMIYKK